MRCLRCYKFQEKSGGLFCIHCGQPLPAQFLGLLSEDSKLQNGNFRIEYALGRGGFGVTYKAYDEELARDVAIKEYFPGEYSMRDNTSQSIHISTHHTQAYEANLKRFRAEGRRLAAIHHPNVVQIHTIFSENNTAYLVMEYVEGNTLRQLMSESPQHRVSFAQTMQIMEGVVQALHAVHQRDISHLDISPENILLRDNGDPVLIDFGAAKGAKEITESAIQLRRSYAPPELEIDRRGTPASDVFELGMVLHEMVTGEIPPSGLARRDPSRQNWHSQAGEPWDQLIEQMLQLNAEQRPMPLRSWWEKNRPVPQRGKNIPVQFFLTSTQLKEGGRFEYGDAVVGQFNFEVPANSIPGEFVPVEGHGEVGKFGGENGDAIVYFREKRESEPSVTPAFVEPMGASEATEPEVVTPEWVIPEAEVAESEVVEPELFGSAVAEPEINEFQISEPEFIQRADVAAVVIQLPVVVHSEVVEPELAEPEVVTLEAQNSAVIEKGAQPLTDEKPSTPDEPQKNVGFLDNNPGNETIRKKTLPAHIQPEEPREISGFLPPPLQSPPPKKSKSIMPYLLLVVLGIGFYVFKGLLGGNPTSQSMPSSRPTLAPLPKPTLPPVIAAVNPCSKAATAQIAKLKKNPILRDSAGRSALFYTAATGDTLGTSAFLFDINMVDNGGRTPLHYAAECGGVDTTTQLMKAGAKQLRAKDGATPRSLAGRRTRRAINKFGHSQQDNLQKGIIASNVAQVRSALEQGASPDLIPNPDKKGAMVAALNEAAYRGQYNAKGLPSTANLDNQTTIIRLLLDYGASSDDAARGLRRLNIPFAMAKNISNTIEQGKKKKIP